MGQRAKEKHRRGGVRGWQGCDWERRESEAQSFIELLGTPDAHFLTGQVFRAALSNMVALAPRGI